MSGLSRLDGRCDSRSCAPHLSRKLLLYGVGNFRSSDEDGDFCDLKAQKRQTPALALVTRMSRRFNAAPWIPTQVINLSRTSLPEIKSFHYSCPYDDRGEARLRVAWNEENVFIPTSPPQITLVVL